MLRRASAWLDRQHMVAQVVILLLLLFAIRTFFFGFYQVPTGSMETTMLVGDRFFADKFTPYLRSGKRLIAGFWSEEAAKKPLFQRGSVITFNQPDYPYSKNWLMNLWQRYVWGPSNWTKRIIGIPGDHVQGKIEDGKPVVYVNGKKLDEPYLNRYPLLAVWTARQCMLPSLIEPEADCLTYLSYDPSKSFDAQPFYRIDERNVVSHPSVPTILKPGTPLDDYGFMGAGGAKATDVFDVHLGPNEYWVMGDNRLGSNDSRYWGPLDEKLIHGRILLRILSTDSSESWLLWDIIRHPIAFWSKVRWSRCFNLVS